MNQSTDFEKNFKFVGCGPFLHKELHAAQISRYCFSACGQRPEKDIPLWASAGRKKLIENYILALLKANRYARIRGEGSDRGNIGIWYDPHTAEFYLPAKTFFQDMIDVLNLQLYPKRWTLEKNLVCDGILCVQEDGRRTWQMIVVRGGERQSVLKISLKKFFEKYRKIFTSPYS